MDVKVIFHISLFKIFCSIIEAWRKSCSVILLFIIKIKSKHQLFQYTKFL